MNLPCFIAFVDSTTNKTFTENKLEKSLKKWSHCNIFLKKIINHQMYTIDYRIMIILYAGIICSYKKGVRNLLIIVEGSLKHVFSLSVSDMNFIKPMSSKNCMP